MDGGRAVVLHVVSGDVLVKLCMDIANIGGGHGDHDEGAILPSPVPGDSLVGQDGGRNHLDDLGGYGVEGSREVAAHGHSPISGGVEPEQGGC